jgi:hypothetical protein
VGVDVPGGSDAGGIVGGIRNVPPLIEAEEWRVVVTGVLTTVILLAIGAVLIAFAYRRGKR